MPQIDLTKVQWDEPAGPVIDPTKVQWDEAPDEGVLAKAGRAAKGFVAGVADIGQTLLKNNAALGLFEDVAPGISQANVERGKTLDSINADNKDSTAYALGRVGGNVAATLPVGGAIGAAGKAVAPLLGRAAPIVEAVSNAAASGGMRTGATLSFAGNMAARATGGALSGAVSAGLVDPDSAATGAAIGAALPAVVGGLGAAGRALRSAGTPAAVPPGVRNAAQEALAAGYVLPPTQVRPTMMNSLAEGLGGKLKTRQMARESNQVVSNNLAKSALGLQSADDLTPEALQALRNQAGDAYAAVRGAGPVAADDAYMAAIDSIGATHQGAARSFPGLGNNGVQDLMASLKQKTFDAGDAVDALKVLREKADAAYRAGDSTVGKASKQAATALEDLLERSLQGAGKTELVQSMRAAREAIAKTYSVQKALNPSSGNVDALALARQMNKGKPLSGDLKTVAKFGNAFPLSAKPVEAAGGVPMFSPLDLAGAGMATGPAGVLGMLSRPALRSYALSPGVQRGLLGAADDVPQQALLGGPDAMRLLGLGALSAPVLGSGR